MPTLIPTVSVGVSRMKGSRNQTIFPPMGELFDFTDEEVRQIRAAHPDGLRKPINEMAKVKAKPAAEVTSDYDDAPEEDEGEVVLEEFPVVASPRGRRVATPASAGRRARRDEDEDL